MSLVVRPVTSANIQFLNANTNATGRPIILHQKGTTGTTGTTSSQPQLLTVMPAGVRVQQLTPIVRTGSNQPTTIVRLMSPATSTIRPGIGQQQFIQLNTNKQQQPMVIKAITASATNRQQQPILLTTNTQSKTILPHTQQQVFVLNPTQAQKLTLQMANKDHDQQPSTTDNHIPQVDGAVDDQQVERFLFDRITSELKYLFFQPLRNGTSGMFDSESRSIIADHSLSDLQHSSSPISQPQQTSSE